MARKFIPRKITESQKDAAHNLFTNEEKGDAPKSDLGLIYHTAEERAEFDRDADHEVGRRYWENKAKELAAEESTRRRYMDPLHEDLRAAAEQMIHRPSRRADAAAMLAGNPRPALLSPTPTTATAPRYTTVDLDKHEEMAGRLYGRDAILNYIRAGNATVTLVSRRTGTRYTFKFQRPKDWEPGPQRPVAPVFCKVLTGADNVGDYTFAGTMWPEDSAFSDGGQVYRHGKNTRVSFGAASVKALIWFVRTALAPGNDVLLERCEVWHEGRCGRCGRKLTVPSSIRSGFGPECEGRML